MTSPGPVTVPTDGTQLGAQVRRIPPPAYYGAAFFGGLLLERVTFSLGVGGRPASAALGGLILTAGAALGLAGAREVLRHRTTIVPHHAVSTLVTVGAYRVSRNPMYTGLAIAYVGGAILAGTAWPLLTLPLAVLAIRRSVIDPEEHYLTETFGQMYRDYRGRVRRWL